MSNTNFIHNIISTIIQEEYANGSDEVAQEFSKLLWNDIHTKGSEEIGTAIYEVYDKYIRKMVGVE